MGMSPRAKLAYGYNLGGEETGWLVEGVDEDGYWTPSWFNRPEDDGDEGAEELATVAENLLLADAGFTEADWQADGYYERKRAAEARIGVEFSFSGHSDYAGTLLIAIGSRRSVEWSEAMTLDPNELLTRPGAEQWDAKLAAALRVLDFTPTQDGPKWLVYPTYG